MFVGRSKQQYQNSTRTPSRGKRRSRQKKSLKGNIIKDKKWIGMDCASISRAVKTGVIGERRRGRVERLD